MDLTIPSTALADACAYLARYVATNPVIPQLAALRVTAGDGCVALSCYDLEVSAQATTTAAVAEAGVVVLPGRLLVDITARLPDGEARILTEPGTSRVSIRCGATAYRLPTIDATTLPPPPATPRGSDGTVSAAAFADAIARVSRAAGIDESTPALTAVLLTGEAEGMTLVATDRYRLAVDSVAWTSPGLAPSGRSALVRAVTLRAAATGMRARDDDAGVSVSLGDADGGQLAAFVGTSRAVTTRVIDGVFPPWASLLPADSRTQVEVDTEALTNAVRRCSLVTPKKTPVRLTFDVDRCKVEAGAADSPEARDHVAAQRTGPPLAVHLNHAYLLDGLAAVPTTRVAFACDGATKPVVLRAVGDVAPAFRYLVMPVRQ